MSQIGAAADRARRFTSLSTRPMQRRLGTSRKRSFPPLRGLVPLLAFLVYWQVLADPRSPFYPPPSAWWKALRVTWSDGTLLPAVGSTIEALIISLMIATVIGTALGIVVGASARADRALGPSLEFMRSMPAATVVPVAALILGNTLRMNLTVITFASLWPVLLSTRAGVLSMNPLLLDVSRTLKLSRRALLAKIVLPSLIPSILLGVSVAAPVTLIVTLLVEILTASSGIGALIADAQAQFNSAEVYGLATVAGLLALAISQTVALVSSVNSRFESTRKD